MKDRVNHDAEWEEAAWAKLLNSNQDILVLMGRLHERSLITQDMINMATLPDKPPPPREQDMRGVSALDSHHHYPHSNMEGSMMGPNPMYGGNSSMMGGTLRTTNTSLVGAAQGATPMRCCACALQCCSSSQGCSLPLGTECCPVPLKCPDLANCRWLVRSRPTVRQRLYVWVVTWWVRARCTVGRAALTVLWSSCSAAGGRHVSAAARAADL
jgi:hypothetical protein